MHELLAPGASLERLATGATWGEGPVWLPDRSSLRWSDIPADRILEWSATTGDVTEHARPAGFANGRTLDLGGRVVQCSHGRRRVERDVDGVVTGLCDRWQGHRLNSPNDVVVASDGAIWFTDPPYGILPGGREGYPAPPEYDGCYVFRLEESTGRLDAVITDMVHPNGLAFSPDERTLYVSDTGHLQVEGAPRGIRAYPVVDGGVGAGRLFVEVRPGASDGIRVDVDGRVWSSSEDSVQVFAPDGRRVLVIPVPERVGNLCFGGADGRDLFVAASTSLYRIRTTTTDAARRSG